MVLALRQSFHLQLFSNCQKGVEILLCHIHLSVIHEVQDCKKICVLDVP